jgi:hypothetical protein
MQIEEKHAALPVSKAKTAYGLLREIQQWSREAPERMRMAVEVRRGKALQDAEELMGWKRPACGAVGCVAGWVVLSKRLTDPVSNYGMSFNHESPMEKAQQVLGLTSRQYDELFTPSRLVNSRHQGTRRHAQAVIRHIDRFITKYRSQLRWTKV